MWLCTKRLVSHGDMMINRKIHNVASNLPSTVRIVEVGLRDGLQNEPPPMVTAEDKAQLAQMLLGAGLRSIEVGSFVSPKWVPQMANSTEVFKILKSTVSPDQYARFSALTPNMKGLEAALSLDIQEVAIFGAASESFSQKNINCSVKESMDRFEEVCKTALATVSSNGAPVRVRGYISCVLGCPYEGYIEPEKVSYVASRMLDMGCFEISLGDTIGVGTAGSTSTLLNHILKTDKEGNGVLPIDKAAVHFHDTYGQALANILTALQYGVNVIDSSVSGLGGCPYAKGASGNVSTEDVVYMLQGLGISTSGDAKYLGDENINMNALLSAANFIDKNLNGRQTSSKVGAALRKD